MISDVNRSIHSCDVACRIWCVQWNHAGTILASCGDDKTIKLWKRIDGNFSFQKKIFFSNLVLFDETVYIYYN